MRLPNVKKTTRLCFHDCFSDFHTSCVQLAKVLCVAMIRLLQAYANLTTTTTSTTLKTKKVTLLTVFLRPMTQPVMTVVEERMPQNDAWNLD